MMFRALRGACALASLVPALSSSACAERAVHEQRIAPADDAPTDDGDDGDDAGEGDGVDEIEAIALPLVVRFREPGQHVVINVQAVDTMGAHPYQTVESEEVPQPFVLDDSASDGAKSATTHLEVIAEDAEIVVSGRATFTTDEVAYVVAQAGTLPLEVCAQSATAVSARFDLVCDGALSVTGSGIAALTAVTDGGQTTWCSGVNVDGDPTLIPLDAPETAESVVPFTDGEACWPVDVYVGANSDDEKPGFGEANGTFTFTAVEG